MELSDYDILGITQNTSFRMVKNAYYDLSRIYHPDSSHGSRITGSLSKEDKLISFQKIQIAYDNIKKKLNVVEIDLPQTEIQYQYEETIIKNEELCEINNESNSNKEELHKQFNEKFNKLFHKVGSQENSDNPYSIFYKEPKKEKRNICDTQLAMHSSSINKMSNTHEFGINYVDDHSTDICMDINQMENCDESIGNTLESTKEIVDKEIDKKLKQLLEEREEKIKISDKELNFIERQKQLKNEIDNSKKKIMEQRNKMYLN